jgi:hypothetical protein
VARKRKEIVRTEYSPPPYQSQGRVRPAFIDRREIKDGEPSGRSESEPGEAARSLERPDRRCLETVRIGLSKTDQARLDCMRIEIEYPASAASRVEKNQTLEIRETGRFEENWGFMRPRIMRATASIVPFETRFSNIVDNIPRADCRSLEKRFGADYAKRIADTPAVLD